MNEKKNKSARKVLLVGISAVLVAAISVGSTLAYLSAITTSKDNTFTASGDIKGRLLEPSWSTEVSSDAAQYVPGKTYAKDPTVDNETPDAAVYVGAKLIFQIDVGDGNGLQTVDYDTFSHFVTLADYTGSGWTEKSVSGDTTSKYFMYNTVLTKDADEGNTLGASATDHTSALFTSVTPSKDINIKSNGTATKDNLTSTADLSSLYFKKFDFKIKVFSHGVKAYTVDKTSGNKVGTDVSTASEAENEILSKLASKN